MGTVYSSPGHCDGSPTCMTTGDDPSTPAVEHGWYDFSVTTDGTTYWVQVDPTNFTGVLAGYINTNPDSSLLQANLQPGRPP